MSFFFVFQNGSSRCSKWVVAHRFVREMIECMHLELWEDNRENTAVNGTENKYICIYMTTLWNRRRNNARDCPAAYRTNASSCSVLL